MFQRAPSRIVTFPVFRTPRDFFCFFCDVSLSLSFSFSLSLSVSLSLSPFASVSLARLVLSFVRSFVALVSGARHVILDDSLDQRRRIASLCPLEAGNDTAETRLFRLSSHIFSPSVVRCTRRGTRETARCRSLAPLRLRLPPLSSSFPNVPLFSSLLFSSLFFFSFLPSFLCFLLRFFRYYSCRRK